MIYFSIVLNVLTVLVCYYFKNKELKERAKHDAFLKALGTDSLRSLPESLRRIGFKKL